MADDLTSFLSSSFPEYRSPPPPRLQSLYSDIYRQKVSNPEGYKSSVAWWTRTLERISRAGKQPQSDDHVVLHASNDLLEGLRWEKVGRPLGIGAVVEDLLQNKTIIALPSFLNSVVSIYYQPSLSYRVASLVLGTPLWWALSQLNLTGDGDASYSSEQRWSKYHGDYVFISILKEAGDAVIARQKSKPPNFAEALFTRESFKTEFGAVALKGALLSDLDVKVLLKYLERDRQVILTKKEAIKFVDPADSEAIAEGITEVDLGVLEMKTTLQRLTDQISEIERQIIERTEKIGDLLRRGSKTLALSYLRSKKQLEELLGKRLNSQETIQTVLHKIESAATEVEIMKAYDTSAKTLRSVLQHPLLQVDHIDDTMDKMAEVLADHKEIQDAIDLGNEGARAAAGVEEVDDKELLEELAALVQEQKKDEEEARDRKRLEEEVKREEEERQRAAKAAAQIQAASASTQPDPVDPMKDWEKRYEQEKAEKAAQVIRDRAAELQLREKWEKERPAPAQDTA